jgi:hypothetical protein
MTVSLLRHALIRDRRAWAALAIIAAAVSLLLPLFAAGHDAAALAIAFSAPSIACLPFIVFASRPGR